MCVWQRVCVKTLKSKSRDQRASKLCEKNTETVEKQRREAEKTPVMKKLGTIDYAQFVSKKNIELN